MHLRPGLTKEQTSHECVNLCKAACCKAPFNIELGLGELDEFLSLAEQRGKKVVVAPTTRNKALVRIAHADQPNGHCIFLGDDNRCGIYDQRPGSCREFPQARWEGCMISGGGPPVVLPEVTLGLCHNKFNILTPHLVNYDQIRLYMQRRRMWTEPCRHFGIRIDDNRNLLVMDWLKNYRNNWLLWLDDDMIYPRNCAEVLVKDAEATGAQVVGGLYFHALESYPQVRRYVGEAPGRWGQPSHHWRLLEDEVYSFLDKNGLTDRIGDAPYWLEGAKENIIECDAACIGFCLVHRSVYEKIEPPWFQDYGDTHGDLMFFKKAMDAGFKCVVDMGLIAGHLLLRPTAAASFVHAYRAATKRKKQEQDGREPSPDGAGATTTIPAAT